jgi:hypothetical protein
MAAVAGLCDGGLNHGARLCNIAQGSLLILCLPWLYANRQRLADVAVRCFEQPPNTLPTKVRQSLLTDAQGLPADLVGMREQKQSLTYSTIKCSSTRATDQTQIRRARADGDRRGGSHVTVPATAASSQSSDSRRPVTKVIRIRSTIGARGLGADFNSYTHYTPDIGVSTISRRAEKSRSHAASDAGRSV